MIPNIIENIFKYTFDFANKFTKSKFWYLKIAVLGFILTLLLSFPNYYRGQKEIRDSITKQIENPFVKQTYPPDSHMAKRTYRLTMPLVGKVFNLNIVGLLFLQSIFGFLFFIIISKLTYSVTDDRVLAFMICIGFTVIYVGKACIYDASGFFDGTAFFLIVLAMYFKKTSIIFLSVFFACFVDERAIMASFMVMFWWLFNDIDYKNIKIRQLIFSNKLVYTVLISLLIVLITRFSLKHLFQDNTVIELSNVGLVALKKQLNIIIFGLFSGIEFFWLLILIGAIILLQYRKYLLLFGYLTLVTAIVIGASSVADLTRSISYVFPMIFIALKIAHKDFSQLALRKLIFTIVFVSFLFGTYYVVGPKGWWIFPLPVQLLTGSI